MLPRDGNCTAAERPSGGGVFRLTNSSSSSSSTVQDEAMAGAADFSGAGGGGGGGGVTESTRNLSSSSGSSSSPSSSCSAGNRAANSAEPQQMNDGVAGANDCSSAGASSSSAMSLPLLTGASASSSSSSSSASSSTSSRPTNAGGQGAQLDRGGLPRQGSAHMFHSAVEEATLDGGDAGTRGAGLTMTAEAAAVSQRPSGRRDLDRGIDDTSSNSIINRLDQDVDVQHFDLPDGGSEDLATASVSSSSGRREASVQRSSWREWFGDVLRGNRYSRRALQRDQSASSDGMVILFF